MRGSFQLTLGRTLRLALLPLLAAGCRAAPGEPPTPHLEPITSPAGPGAAQPFVAAHGDDFILSWTEPAGAGHALRFAVWRGGDWSEPRTVAHGADWFVNWADFPSVVPLGESTLLAHWLQRSGPGRYSYDVWLSRSADGGVTWSRPVRPHRDGTETEHGFVSLFPLGDDAGVIWLDGRRFVDAPDAAASNEMMLQFTTLDASGRLGAEAVIDPRVCDCCQTAVAQTRAGPVVVFRDRSADEVRDIAISRYVDGRWTAPVPVHRDGWVINACPVNGPAIAADGDHVVVTWFTAADEEPRVYAALSSDAGASFAAPLRLDAGDPVGRVDVVLVDGVALVSWLERSGDGADIRARALDRQGRAGATAVLATTTAGRAGGFPRMAAAGGRIFIAWTAPGDTSRVEAALVRLHE